MIHINYDLLVMDLLPTPLKKVGNNFDWLKTITYPINNYLYNYMLNYETITKYDILHNSQVLSLEHLLNDILQPTQPIYIEDAIWKEETYIFVNGETILIERNDLTKQQYIYTSGETGSGYTYIYTKNEFDQDEVDFIIFVQDDDYADADLLIQINAYAYKYKISGMTFRIEAYT